MRGPFELCRRCGHRGSSDNRQGCGGTGNTEVSSLVREESPWTQSRSCATSIRASSTATSVCSARFASARPSTRRWAEDSCRPSSLPRPARGCLGMTRGSRTCASTVTPDRVVHELTLWLDSRRTRLRAAGHAHRRHRRRLHPRPARSTTAHGRCIGKHEMRHAVLRQLSACRGTRRAGRHVPPGTERRRRGCGRLGLRAGWRGARASGLGVRAHWRRSLGVVRRGCCRTAESSCTWARSPTTERRSSSSSSWISGGSEHLTPQAGAAAYTRGPSGKLDLGEDLRRRHAASDGLGVAGSERLRRCRSSRTGWLRSRVGSCGLEHARRRAGALSRVAARAAPGRRGATTRSCLNNAIRAGPEGLGDRASRHSGLPLLRPGRGGRSRHRRSRTRKPPSSRLTASCLCRRSTTTACRAI